MGSAAARPRPSPRIPGDVAPVSASPREPRCSLPMPQSGQSSQQSAVQRQLAPVISFSRLSSRPSRGLAESSEGLTRRRKYSSNVCAVLGMA